MAKERECEYLCAWYVYLCSVCTYACGRNVFVCLWCGYMSTVMCVDMCMVCVFVYMYCISVVLVCICVPHVYGYTCVYICIYGMCMCKCR